MSTSVELSRTDRRLRATYAVFAVAALVGTQWALIRHLSDGGTLRTFFTDPVVNPAATFLTLDALFVGAAAVVFMLVEGRRLRMRRLWVYVVLTFTVAVSVAFPVFLAVRQGHVARARSQGGQAVPA